MDNPLNKSTVGKEGNTLVTNYAWLDVEFDGFRISNIPLKETEYNNEISNEKKHAIHMGGYNCYVKTFSCTRAIPKGVVSDFWNDAGGSLECSLTVFDPTFVQFENLIIQSIKNQKVHCKVSYGISKLSSGSTPKPFEAHCFLTKMEESVLASGTEWSLTLNTVPPEIFDEYPEKGASRKKETVYKLGLKSEYKRVSDLVVKLLSDEGWNGVVIETDELKKSYKIPTKDFLSKIDLVRTKLAPMARCSDDQIKELYHLIIGLDNSVYFMPFGMTIKEALESKNAKKFGNFDLQDKLDNSITTQSTIEQLNMQDYISEQDGALVFKYGFQNSIVQSLNINYDCMSMISQFFFTFNYKDKDNNIKSFRFPDFDDSLLKNKDTRVINKQITLYNDNEEDAREMAKTIVRTLQVTDYEGSAVLINWPYIQPLQEIRFEYLIPNGSAMALKLSNNVGENSVVGSIDNSANVARNINNVQDFDTAAKINKDNSDRSENNSVIGNKKEVTSLYHDTLIKEEKTKSLRSKGLKGNKANSSLKKDADFRTNIGIPASLTSWSDTHKQSVTYIVQSIKDTIEGGIMTTELELKGSLRSDFPQLNQSL